MYKDAKRESGIISDTDVIQLVINCDTNVLCDEATDFDSHVHTISLMNEAPRTKYEDAKTECATFVSWFV